MFICARAQRQDGAKRWCQSAQALGLMPNSWINANILPSTGQENNIAQPKTDEWFSFSPHFSSFLTV